ncbi:MAG: polysaccharide deacetylase family protein [Clostridia bacterium]|nr:polysaccharide deacetylase family protein [Clostridia bacterium]
MRFISLLATFAAVILSIVLGFATYNDSKDIDRYEKEIEIYMQQQQSYQAEIDIVSPQIEEAIAEKTVLEQDIAAIKKRIIYKTQPTAFLTFDDGTSYNTLKILDILKANNIKATFFVVGTQILNGGSASKEAIQRIVDEGHVLAIHAYEHEYSKIYSSAEAYFEDFNKIADLLYEMTGFKPNIVRLPSGTASARSFCGKYAGSTDVYYDIISKLYADGYTVIDWNVDTVDYTTSTGVDKIVENAVSGAKTRLSREYKAAVILMHDTADTVSALQRVIDGVEDLGMGFEVLVKGGYVTRQIAETEKP